MYFDMMFSHRQRIESNHSSWVINTVL